MDRSSRGRRRIAALALIGLALAASACATQAATDTPRPTGVADVASVATATAAPTTTAANAPTASVTAGAESGSPTPGRVQGTVLGAGIQPGYSVASKPGWAVDGKFIVKTDGLQPMGISVWDVGNVPTDPCSWKTTLRDPGPTVHDLVAALRSETARKPTTPKAVTLDGHAGTYLEWSVPSDLVVTGDADFAGCDDPGNGHHDYVSWFGTGGGERYEQVAGQVDRLWILDVGGRRLLVDATYSPYATRQEIRDEEAVVSSIRFTTP